MEEQTDLFHDYKSSFQAASQGNRLLNYLIDTIIFYILIFIIFFILGALAPDVFADDSSLSITLLFYLIVFGIMVGYYTIFERFANGKTIGKMITRTKAIRLDGQPLTTRDALLRSLSRLVPFEAFSGFGTPWHDSWTQTSVVSDKNIYN